MRLLFPIFLHFQLRLYSSSLLEDCAGSPGWEHCLLFSYILSHRKIKAVLLLLCWRGRAGKSQFWKISCCGSAKRHWELLKVSPPSTLHILSYSKLGSAPRPIRFHRNLDPKQVHQIVIKTSGQKDSKPHFLWWESGIMTEKKERDYNGEKVRIRCIPSVGAISYLYYL